MLCGRFGWRVVSGSKGVLKHITPLSLGEGLGVRLSHSLGEGLGVRLSQSLGEENGGEAGGHRMLCGWVDCRVNVMDKWFLEASHSPLPRRGVRG